MPTGVTAAAVASLLRDIRGAVLPPANEPARLPDTVDEIRQRSQRAVEQHRPLTQEEFDIAWLLNAYTCSSQPPGENPFAAAHGQILEAGGGKTPKLTVLFPTIGEMHEASRFVERAMRTRPTKCEGQS